MLARSKWKKADVQVKIVRMWEIGVCCDILVGVDDLIDPNYREQAILCSDR
jgi:hypothetical protein